MTAVSLINPYAPQPVNSLGGPDAVTPYTMVALKPSGAPSDTGLASDQSGQGAGNGTGTGGAQLGEMLKRGRQDLELQRATPESVVEAQSSSAPAAEFLERRARQRIEAKAAEEARRADRAEARADAAAAEAEKAAEVEYVMPNPLPTAPILQRDES